MTTAQRNIAHYERLLLGSLTDAERRVALAWLAYCSGRQHGRTTMPICNDCQHFAPAPGGFGACAIHGIEVYWGHTCDRHSALQPPQQQSACRPVMLTNPLVCPRCRSLNVCVGWCIKCGARVYP